MEVKDNRVLQHCLLHTQFLNQSYTPHSNIISTSVPLNGSADVNPFERKTTQPLHTCSHKSSGPTVIRNLLLAPTFLCFLVPAYVLILHAYRLVLLNQPCEEPPGCGTDPQHTCRTRPQAVARCGSRIRRAAFGRAPRRGSARWRRHHWGLPQYVDAVARAGVVRVRTAVVLDRRRHHGGTIQSTEQPHERRSLP